MNQKSKLTKLSVPACWGVAFVAVVAISAAMVLQSVDNHDIAWILYQATSLLDGGKLYVTYQDTNPPLIFWLTVPPAALARALGCDDFLTLHACQFVLAGAFILFCHRIVRRLGLLPNSLHRRLFFLAVTFVLLSLPAFQLGQREWVMFALVLPYLLVTVGRAGKANLPWRLTVTAGIAAGVGIAIKPYFLLLWLGLEVYLTAVRKTGWFFRRPESAIVVATQGLYALLVATLTPEYLQLLPTIERLYGAYNNPFSTVLLNCLGRAPMAFLALALLAVFRPPPETKEPARVLALTTAMLLLVALVQQKGWGYHLYPAEGAGVLLLMVLGAGLCRDTAPVREMIRLGPGHLTALLAATLLAGAVYEYVIRNDRQEWNDSPKGQFCRLLERNGRGTSVAVLSTNLSCGFPMVNYAGAHWTLRQPCLWMLPGLYEHPPTHGSRPPYRSRAEMDDDEKWLVDSVVDDFRKHRPEFVFVDASTYKVQMGDLPFDFIEYFSLDPSFRAMWRDYKPIPTNYSLQVYVRRDVVPQLGP